MNAFILPSETKEKGDIAHVSRFAGLVVRNALALEMKDGLLGSPLCSPVSAWRKMVELAKEDNTGLQPWWHMPGVDIRRYRFALDISRDEHKFGYLQSQRMIYRLALGHPNQHDLIKTLSVDDENTLTILQSLVLNLSPFSTAPRHS